MPGGTAIVGLTGSQRDIETAARAFREYSLKTPTTGGVSLIDHSALFSVVDASGRIAEPPGELAAQIRTVA
jgi:cytochrome oxidase Cu insertion factor (SCO1/SenC/PrrC family)